MTDSPLPEPPTLVHKRDGQLVPFDADKISRALFAAGEGLGRPDAFLARELADGVVHFLTVEREEATPTTEQISELVIKVVRELGQPALAETFARFAEKRRRTAASAGVREPPRPASPAALPPRWCCDSRQTRRCPRCCRLACATTHCRRCTPAIC